VTPGHVLTVDPIACDGHGLCAELVPELVTLDDWGYPLVSGHPVPTGLGGAAREAVALCPKLALRLRAQAR
jgi:ferredoxin